MATPCTRPSPTGWASTDGGATFSRKTTDNGLGSNTVNGVYASGSTVYAATAGGLSIGTLSIGNGAVTGSAVFTDPAGRTLTYTAPTTSTGGGTVSINASTGAFAYTPTTDQRAAATGPTTDTFTITVSNGDYSATQVVTVSVARQSVGHTGAISRMHKCIAYRRYA